jgi:hypothetical protein
MVSEAVLLVEALLWSEITYITPLIVESPTTQPSKNNGPFTRARCENSIRITAMMAETVIATPTAGVKTSLIPWPIAPTPFCVPTASRLRTLAN